MMSVHKQNKVVPDFRSVALKSVRTTGV